MKITKTNETTIEVDPWPDTEKVNIHVDVDGITDNKPVDTIVLPRPAQSAFIKLLTDKEGDLATRIQITKGKVWRPHLADEGNRRFIAEILEPITGKNFTGKVDLKIELKPNSLGLLLDNEFYARISTT